MISTMRELRNLIAENCDFTQPLRVVAHDVGKKASKHSAVRADEFFPAAMNVTPGKYSEKSVIEIAHDPEQKVLMPEAAIEAIDELLYEEPRALVGWVYFFYFPFEVTTLFGRKKHAQYCMLDTSNVKDIYLGDEPNTLVIEAEYGPGTFD